MIPTAMTAVLAPLQLGFGRLPFLQHPRYLLIPKLQLPHSRRQSQPTVAVPPDYFVEIVHITTQGREHHLVHLPSTCGAPRICGAECVR